MDSVRTCIVCRKKGAKDNFIKIVMNKQQGALIEYDKKLEGRGAYICKSPECLAKNIKTKALNRAFKTAVPAEVYEELIEKFGN